MRARLLWALAAFAALVPAAPALATHDPGDDRMMTAATPWWVYTGVTKEWIDAFATANDARITDLHVESTSTPLRFSVVLVRNRGSYESPWRWFGDITMEEARHQAARLQLTIIKAHVYETPAGARAAVLMLRYTAITRWFIGTKPDIERRLAADSTRLVSLNAIGNGYFVVTMAHDRDDKHVDSWWYVGASLDSVTANLAAHRARLVDLDRNADGTWNAVMVPTAGTRWHWWTDEPPAALRDKAAAAGERIIDFRTYDRGGTTLASAVTIDNTGPDCVLSLVCPSSAPPPADGPEASANPSPTRSPDAPPARAADGDAPPLLPIGLGIAALAAALGVAAHRRRRPSPGSE